MYKVLCFLKKKPGMTLEAFIDHYETSHVPLAFKLLPQIKEHRRNFVRPETGLVPPGCPTPYFDCVTELWFDDRAGFDGMLASLGVPAIAEPLTEDELRFLDRDKCSMFPVEENITRR